jgi:LysR family nitrogen assimilation transcriptional regulator
MGRLDLALLFGDEPDPDLLKRILLEERLSLVAAPNHAPLAKTIRLRQMVGMELVLPGKEHGLRKIIDDVCLQQGIHLNVVAEIDSLTSVKKAVANGIGSTILSQSSVIEEVQSGHLQASTVSDSAMKRRVVCATSITRPTTSASAAVIGLVTDLIRAMVESGTWPAQWIGEVRSTRNHP